MKIFRDVEMYSWQKKRNTRRGYDEYSRTWTRTPSKNVGVSYENPEMGLRMMTFVASSGQIGSYSFDPLEAKFAVDANDYSTATPLKISQENLNHDNDSLRLELFEDHVGSPRTGEILAKKRFASTDGKYVYLVNDLPSTPEIGDLRLSYHVIQDRYQATAFGVLKGKQLTRIGPGIRTFVLPGERQVALANLKRDAGTAMLITRIELYVLLNLIVLIVLIPFFAFSWFTNRPQNPSRLVESLLAVCISLIVSTTMTVASIFVYDMRIVLVFLFLVIAAILLFLFARFLLRRPSPGPQ
jgi:hypothetical protein